MGWTTPDSSSPLETAVAAVRRHHRAALGFFALAVLSVGLLTMLSPRTYRSEGKLFVRLGRENATLDPTATVGQEPMVAVTYSYETEVNSAVEVLQSHRLLEEVVDAVGPSAVLRPADSKLIAWGRWQATGRAPSPESRAEAVWRLAKNLQVTPVKKSNIIQVTCLAQSPELAQKLVAKLIDHYLDENIRLNRPPEEHEFFVAQAERMRAELVKKEETLRDLKTATGLASPREQRELLVRRMARVQDELFAAEAEETAARRRVETLQKQLAALPPTRLVSSTAGIADEARDRMREQFYVLQIRREEAAAKYTPEHPAMQRVEQQLAASREILDRQKRTQTQATTAINPSYEETHSALLREEPLLASTQARAAAMRSQLALLTKQWKAFNEDELRIAQLDREAELMQASYRKNVAALDQARLDHALESQRMSNISIVQSATLDPRPVSPSMALSLALGALLGVAGGLGLALFQDRSEHLGRNPLEIEQSLNIPVLGSLPIVAKTVAFGEGNGRRRSHA